MWYKTRSSSIIVKSLPEKNSKALGKRQFDSAKFDFRNTKDFQYIEYTVQVKVPVP